ncbi:MAG: hypothetical protein N4A68_16105 [Maledivibacter sp.]|jgi:hypothetical protein|nr:hypothetical protein [Maledivibacter sp.]
MNAFHANWTKPFFIKHPNEDYFIEDFELLVAILSALKWRQKNGSIKMYVDKIGYKYYEKLGLGDIYDLGIDDSLEKSVPKTLKPHLFWAAGKIYALAMEQTPITMLDMDFIVWDSIAEETRGHDLCVTHREILNEMIYPKYKKFSNLYDYDYDDKWDWMINPCNTALAHFNNQKLKDYYVDEAMTFMNTEFILPKDQRNQVTLMVFAEQRLLSMCAKKMGIEITSYISNNIDISQYQKYTHIWGYKKTLCESNRLRKEFCENCIGIILDEFPDTYDTLCNIECIWKYLKKQ